MPASSHLFTTTYSLDRTTKRFAVYQPDDLALFPLYVPLAQLPDDLPSAIAARLDVLTDRR